MQKRNRKDKMASGNADAQIPACCWRRYGRTVGLVSAGLLTVVGVATVNPVVRTESVLALATDTDTDSLPSGAMVDLNAYNETQSEVTLTMDASTENGRLNASAADTNPDAAADVVRRTASVELTNTSGYTVKIRGSSANLTGATTPNVIPSVTTTTTLGQMENAWGWNGSVGDTVADCSPASTFKQMTTDDQELGSGGAESSATKKVTMCFGARIDGTKAADTYSNTVTLSVVAQPGKVATFDGITQMQQMTPAICKAAEVNDTAQLEDVRDGKKYWVTKLLDGNCWMSQNLDFDISTTNVTTATSDVVSDWTSSSTRPPRATTTSVTTGSASYMETYSWDLGQYVINAPTVTAVCADNATGLANCAMFTDVAGWTASDDPSFYKNNNGSSVNADTKTYDAHYLVGNYYQWNAATAGTGGGVVDQNTTGSICPKGWKLPNSGKDQLQKGSFNYMLLQYGLANEDGSGYSAVTGTSKVNGYTYNITLSPLFGVRGGYVNPDFSTPFRGAGLSGNYWSSRATSSTSTAYYLYFSTSVYPSYNVYRYYAYSLRCLVPTS